MGIEGSTSRMVRSCGFLAGFCLLGALFIFWVCPYSVAHSSSEAGALNCSPDAHLAGAPAAPFPLPEGGARKMVLNTANAPPRTTPDGKGFQDLLLKEAFRRMGIGIEIVHLPSERALTNANEGIDDGAFVRIAGLSSIYPNLVCVHEPITEFEFVAFGKVTGIEVDGWQSLKAYNIGIITGWKILEAKVLSAKSLTKVKDDKALFALLNSDRADVVIYDKLQGMALIEQLGLKDIKVLGRPLAIKPMYLYLNEKHKDLAPEIAESLRAMKQDGSFRNIVDEAMKELMPWMQQ